jgi:hypothetical protein
MKKLIVLVAILALVFVGCGNGTIIPDSDDPDDDNKIGNKIGDTGPGGGNIFFAEGGQYKECSGELGMYNWSDAITNAGNYKGNGFTNWHLPDRAELDLMYRNLYQKGLGGFLKESYWTSIEDDFRDAYYQNFKNGSKGYAGKSILYHVRAVRSFTIDTNKTKLTIKNESGYEITHVFWNNVFFANSATENSIKPGTSVTMTVQAGSGYIRFRPKSNPYSIRTQKLLIVEKDKQEEFVFLRDTVVVKENDNSNNTLASFAASFFTGQIGDTGPGGGIIFFASSGQYKECSVELGLYDWDSAKTTAQNFRGGGFSDWRLPDRGELSLMYENLHSIGKGEFQNNAYWSSTETSANSTQAYYINFNNGTQGNQSKTNTNRVRAVCSFSIY